MTPSPTASGPSAEAMEAAHKFLASAGHGHCCCLMCETAIARAIDDAFKRGQVAERAMIEAAGSIPPGAVPSAGTVVGYYYPSGNYEATAIARAIDAAVKAEREECAKVADVSAKEDWRHARSAERKGDDDVGYLREAKAMCAEDIAEAIRARTP